MSIDAITAKILEDATEYADGLISEAKLEAERTIAAAEQEADAIRDRMHAQASKDAAVLRSRKHAAAELEARKVRLAFKQLMVTNSLEAAIDQLAALEPAECISFLTKKIAETGITEGELLLNAKDREAVGKKLVKEANKALNGGKLVLSDQTIDAKGGFVLKYGAKEINSTLEIMVASLRERVTLKVVEALFTVLQHE